MESPQPKAQSDDAETLTQKQARLRRERREAKLKSDGTSRLEKIAKVSGRQNLPDLPPNIGQVSEDPDEVDLSTHPSATRTPNLQQSSGSNNGPPSEADIRAMLRAGAPQPGTDREAGNNAGGGGGEEEDPMMKMLSQLMGGMPGRSGGGADEGEGGLPPGLAAMFGAAAGGGMAGMGGSAAAPKQENTYAYLWKIVHAVFALCLGVYVTATSTAFQANMTRDDARQVLKETPAGSGGGVNLFFVFATVELVLQSSRFYMEKGNSAGQLGGWFGLVAGFLPKPYRDYLFLIGRYARIWGTVVQDAMVIVFVVGCVAWWNGVVGGV